MGFYRRPDRRVRDHGGRAHIGHVVVQRVVGEHVGTDAAKRRTRRRGRRAPGVCDPFTGLTTDGTVVGDLFTIHSTGVSTAGVVSTAQAWLASLTSVQESAVSFEMGASDYTQDQRRDWTTIDGDRDAGMSLQDMNDDQRIEALSVLAAGMSARGLESADKVRHLSLYGGSWPT